MTWHERSEETRGSWEEELPKQRTRSKEEPAGTRALRQKNALLIQLSSSQELARMRLGGDNSERWQTENVFAVSPGQPEWHSSRLHYTRHASEAPGFLTATQLQRPVLLESAVRSIIHGRIYSPVPLISSPSMIPTSPWASGLGIHSETILCLPASFHIVGFFRTQLSIFHFLFQAGLCLWFIQLYSTWLRHAGEFPGNSHFTIFTKK